MYTCTCRDLKSVTQTAYNQNINLELASFKLLHVFSNVTNNQKVKERKIENNWPEPNPLDSELEEFWHCLPGQSLW